MRKTSFISIFKKALSLMLSAVCISSVFSFSGCRFERELFGSAASGISSSGNLRSSGASQSSRPSGSSAASGNPSSSSVSETSVVSAESSSEEELYPEESSSVADTSKSPESESSSDPIIISSSVEEVSEEESEQTDESSDVADPEDLVSGDDEFQSSLEDYLKLLVNSSLPSLGFRQPPDSLALVLFAPLNVQVNSIPTVDTVALSDTVNTSFLVLPVYNNSTIELYATTVNGATVTDNSLVYRRDETPQGYGLVIYADGKDRTSGFRLLISSGGLRGRYDMLCSRALLGGGEYLLNDDRIENIDYINDATRLVSRGDALKLVIDSITSGLKVVYRWENISSTNVHLYVEPNEGWLSGDYYIESNDLRDGKGCCYYMVSLSRRTYDETGVAVGERVINRYLVVIPGAHIVSMFDENGNINKEYNDIII